MFINAVVMLIGPNVLLRVMTNWTAIGFTHVILGEAKKKLLSLFIVILCAMAKTRIFLK